jgi:hypothetical protein
VIAAGTVLRVDGAVATFPAIARMTETATARAYGNLK